MKFPKLIPSNRTFAPAEWPVSKQRFMTGGSQRMLYQTSGYSSKLRLTYANRDCNQMAEFMAHYDQQFGTRDSFKFNNGWADQVWGGWTKKKDDEIRLAVDGRWRYVGPPVFRQTDFGVGTIEIGLVQVPGKEDCIPADGPGGGSPGRGGDPGNFGSGGSGPEGPDGNGPNAPGGFPGSDGGGGGPISKPSPNPGPDDGTKPKPEPEPEPEPEPIYPDLPEDETFYSYWYRPPLPYRGNTYTGDNWTDRLTTEINRRSEAGKAPHSIILCQSFEQSMGTVPCTQNGSMRSVWNIIDADGRYIGNRNGYCGRLVSGGTIGAFCVEEGFTNDDPPPYITKYVSIQTGEEYPWPLPDWVASTESTRSLKSVTEEQTSSKTSTKFPNHTPSTRGIRVGEWNVKRFAGGNSLQARTMLLPSTAQKSDVILELTYANRADGVARDFMRHYLEQRGTFEDFKLPKESVKKGPMAGWKVPNGDRYLTEGNWSYAAAPQITSVHPGTSTVSLTLITDKGALAPCAPGEDGGGSSGPGGSKPKPSPGPGPGNPAPPPDPPTIPPGFPDDFDPDVFPPGVPPNAPIPTEGNPINQPGDGWQGKNNPEGKRYRIKVYYLYGIYRKGTDFCTSFYSCTGTDGKDYEYGEQYPVYSKQVDGVPYGRDPLTFPSVPVDAEWELAPYNDKENFAYNEKSYTSGYPEEWKQCWPPDTSKTTGENCIDPYCKEGASNNPGTILPRGGRFRLKSNKAMSSGGYCSVKATWSTANYNPNQKTGVWSHWNTIYKVTVILDGESDEIPYYDESDAWGAS